MAIIHIYKEIRNPCLGEVLQYERDPHNVVDRYSVAVKKGVVIGHLPRKVSRLCSLFLWRGGTIDCIVTGARRHSADLPQGGLEVPYSNCDLAYLVPTVLNFNVEKNLCRKYFVAKIFSCV